MRLEALSSHRRSRCSKSIGIWWDLQALSSRANKGTQEIHRCAEPSVHWLIPSHLLIISATLSTSGLTLKQRTNRLRGFPGGARGKEPTCQHRRLKGHGFHPWKGMIPWRRTWQTTPIFLPGETPWTEEPGRSQRVRHN